ncbi:PREDICTED: uncharacterized protein LOC108554869 [Eufriesea mexicana]|uniref:uncharacterized protein LOC108554869 n=1 Tax=Eufriesea mexicana TaxID=516756 RepID=UPI00083C7636|nr:PREDICTED: uncharacterized protein LOC108554869 [Eufriesea mexicana]
MKTFLLIACWIICSATARNTFNPLIKGIEKDLEAVDALQEWNNGPDDGNIVKRDLLTIFETLQQTEEDLPNRVFFYLYTRNNKDNPQQLHIDDVETLNNSYFDAQKPTKFVTHGWRSSSDAPACQLILKAFLENSDCNVILIDWSKIADNEYIWTSDRVQIVGQYAAKMVSFLESQGLDANNLTIVGHSLGAHVAGMTSNYATEKANYIVGECTFHDRCNTSGHLTSNRKFFRKSTTPVPLPLVSRHIGQPKSVTCHNYEFILSSLNLIMLERRREISDILLVYKVLNGPINCSDILEFSINIPTSLLRRYIFVHIQQRKTAFAYYSDINRIIINVNNT